MPILYGLFFISIRAYLKQAAAFSRDASLLYRTKSVDEVRDSVWGSGICFRQINFLFLFNLLFKHCELQVFAEGIKVVVLKPGFGRRLKYERKISWDNIVKIDCTILGSTNSAVSIYVPSLSQDETITNLMFPRKLSKYKGREYDGRVFDFYADFFWHDYNTIVLILNMLKWRPEYRTRIREIWEQYADINPSLAERKQIAKAENKNPMEYYVPFPEYLESVDTGKIPIY